MTFDPFKQAKLMNGFQKLGSVSVSEPDTSVDDLRKLAGVHEDTLSHYNKINAGVQNKGQIQREQGIKPGTEEWFKLWFGDKR